MRNINVISVGYYYFCSMDFRFFDVILLFDRRQNLPDDGENVLASELTSLEGQVCNIM